MADQLVPVTPWATPTPTRLPTLRTAVIRHDGVTLADLRDIFDSGYGRIIAAGVLPTGPAFALYFGDPRASFDLELGFPTDSVPADEVVVESSIPGGPACTLSHLGGYDGLGASWERVLTTVTEEGGTAVALLEVYVTAPEPETDPATLRTDLHAVLRG